jgi:hypothetical protein
MGNIGYTIPIDQEYMLIFGGITAREISYTDKVGQEYDLYTTCEKYN